MGLLPEIDEHASRESARGLLSQYRRLSRIAGVRLTDIQSPTIDGMPKSPSYDNRAEQKILRHTEALVIIEKVQQAMFLMSRTSYWVIYYSYLCEPKLSYYQISQKLIGYSEESVDYLKRIALLEFAEAYPGEELLVFKK